MAEHWTQEEIDLVKRMYPTASDDELLEALPKRSLRSLGGIKLMAYSVGVRKKGG